MAIITKNHSTQITISRAEYDALVHAAQVTKEYIQGQTEQFVSAEECIQYFKQLQSCEA